MLENWLSPVAVSKVCKYKELPKGCFAKKILIYSKEIPDLSNIQIAFIGVDEKEANAVRKELYQYSFPFRSLRIVDLGNVRKHELSFLVPLIKELLYSRIIPIIIGKNEQNTLTQFLAYESTNTPINLAVVDEKIQVDLKKKEQKTFLNDITSKANTHLFHMSFIGYQNHFVNPKVLHFLNNEGYELMRLGDILDQPEELEPIIRDADMMSFNLRAIKFADAPGQKSPTPSGMTSEIACRIARYAGLSDKLSSIGIYGYHKEFDQQNVTAHLNAQMIWYFIHGFYNRKNDYPASLDGLVEYVVGLKEIDHDIHFWKSEKSGRWWMQVPITHKKLTRHHLIPCSYQDYVQACKNDIPERLVNAWKRFE